MTTKILPCDCKSTFQDQTYGVGRRVHNARMKDRRLLGWRCTVCGKKTDATSAEKAASDKKPVEKEK